MDSIHHAYSIQLTYIVYILPYQCLQIVIVLYFTCEFQKLKNVASLMSISGCQMSRCQVMQGKARRGGEWLQPDTGSTFTITTRLPQI